MECGQDAYVDLMKRYPMVTDAFLRLKPGYQKVLYTFPPCRKHERLQGRMLSRLLCFRKSF